MNYPVWDVPILGSGGVIGLIAIFHVMISHFAVGGGLYLPMAESYALKTGRRDWLEFLPRHSKFFLVLTGVYGAASGVAIWFAIGLAAPEATSTLIHNFVFGWAIEWVFFMVELTCAAVYYYTWSRIPDKLHLRVGWLYAAASLMTLVIINGILAFMLTPGQAWLEVAGTGQEASRFFQAFFNPTYWPSLFLRTLVCISLAAVWALVTGSLIDGHRQAKLKETVIRWSVMWLLPAFFLLPLGLVWYLFNVPEPQRGLLELGISTMGSGTFAQITRTVLVSVMASATILAVAYLIAYRNPRDLRFGYACSILFLALLATGAGEQAREMLRKPYVIGQHMYSNAIRKTKIRLSDKPTSQVDLFNASGYLTNSIWVTPEQHAAWTVRDQKIAGAAEASPIEEESASEATLARGQLMFRGQCLACHTVAGYRPMRRYLQGRDYASIRNVLRVLHEHKEDSPYRAYMPPLVGMDGELHALGVYLDHLVNPPTVDPDEVEIAKAD